MVLYCEHCTYAADQQTKLWDCWRCELNASMDKNNELLERMTYSTELNNELLERIADLLEKWLQQGVKRHSQRVTNTFIYKENYLKPKSLTFFNVVSVLDSLAALVITGINLDAAA